MNVENYRFIYFLVLILGIALPAWTGLWRARRLRISEFLDSQHIKVASLSALRRGRLYPSGDTPWYSFLLEDEIDHRTTVRSEGYKSKKVKVTLVQALRLCTGRTAHRGE